MVAESVTERFGGDADANGEGMGAIILGEGAGGGYVAIPWVLDHYERELDLKPAESWLLRRLLKYAWGYGNLVYPSMRKIEREAKVTRNTVMTLFRHLEDKGYLVEVSRGDTNNPADLRNRYDVSGSLVALAFCIICDPDSRWSETHETPRLEKYLKKEFAARLPANMRVGELAKYARRYGYKCDWRDFRQYLPK